MSIQVANQISSKAQACRLQVGRRLEWLEELVGAAQAETLEPEEWGLAWRVVGSASDLLEEALFLLAQAIEEWESTYRWAEKLRARRRARRGWLRARKRLCRVRKQYLGLQRLQALLSQLRAG